MTCDGAGAPLQWLAAGSVKRHRIEPESKSDFVASIRTSSLRSRRGGLSSHEQFLQTVTS